MIGFAELRQRLRFWRTADRIGPDVHIYTNNHRFDDPDIPIYEQGHYPSKQVTVRTGAWIGANAILLPGVTIERNSVVGAGSIVTKYAPGRCAAVGAPARVAKKLD